MQHNMRHYAGIILALIFFTSLAATLNQFKVPPVMPAIMASLSLSIGGSGWLMSIFSLVGVILALPACTLINKLGLKTTGIIALFTLSAGSLLGFFAEEINVMLLSRAIEGMGMCLISVMAPAAIALWFPPQKRGIPMGVWSCWVPLGAITMFNLAPRIATLGSWQSIWLYTALYSFALLVVFSLFFRLPASQPSAGYQECEAPILDTATTRNSPWRNRNIWLLALTFGLFNIVVLSINTFLPNYWYEALAVTPEKAASLASLIMVVALITGPISGLISDAIGSRKTLFLLGLLLCALSVALPFYQAEQFLVVSIIGLGLAFGMVPTAVFSAAPEIMDSPLHAGMGVAIITFGQNIGMFIGPALFGLLVEFLGWSVAGYLLVPVLILAFISALSVKVR